MKKSAIFWCEHCSKKYTIDDFENARQIDLSKIQKKNTLFGSRKK